MVTMDLPLMGSVPIKSVAGPAAMTRLLLIKGIHYSQLPYYVSIVHWLVISEIEII
jgi:hypothetical protein